MEEIKTLKMDLTKQDDLIMFLIFSAVIFFFLLYLVIRSAVSKETKETVKELRRFNRLKYLDLKKQGVTDEEIAHEIKKD